MAGPTADVSAVAWTPSAGATVFETVDEVSPNDADYATSLVPAQPLVLGIPSQTAGSRTVSARLSASGSAVAFLQLLDGSSNTLATGAAHTLTSGAVTYADSLTISSTATRMRVLVYEGGDTGWLGHDGEPLGLGAELLGHV